MKPGEKLRRAREAQIPPVTREELAAIQGEDSNYARIVSYELGRSNPPKDLLAKVAARWNIPFEWFYDGQDNGVPRMEPEQQLGRPMVPVSHGTRRIRYAGIVPCGDWGDPLDSEEMVDVDARYEHPKRFAATVSGDSCSPALLHGDFTVWHYDLAPSPGLIVLAQRKGDHACTVKQLKMDSTGRPHLLPINPQYDEPPAGDGWGVIARLILVQRVVGHAERQWYSRAGLRPEDLA
jgi:transcriptional regulator with XRE-family HTH domain